MSRLPILSMCLFLALVLAGCEDGGRDQDLTGLTPEEFVERLAAAMARDGAVYHATGEMAAIVAGQAPLELGRTEVWLDPLRGVFHHEWRKNPAWQADYASETRSIFAAGVLYKWAPGDRRPLRLRDHRCPPPPLVVVSAGVTNACGAMPRSAMPRVGADVDFEGTAAVALIWEERIEANVSGGPTHDRHLRLYVDRDTFLPLAVVDDYVRITGEPGGRRLTRYRGDFVAIRDLPPDFFDPASIGWVDPATALDRPDLGVPVYWLGRRFEPGGGLPSLEFDAAHVLPGPGGGPGHQADIRYVGERFSLTLWLWRPDAWETFIGTSVGRLEWDSPCARRQEIALPRGRAVLFMTFEPERRPDPGRIGAAASGQPASLPPAPPPDLHPSGCPTDRPFDRFLAHVYLDGVVVAINTPVCFQCVGGGDAPYDSEAGVRVLIAGLRPRLPGE